jgi:hypothetical protein
VPPIAWQPNFVFLQEAGRLPQAVARRRHSMSQSTAPGRVPRAKGSKRRCKHRPHGGYDHSQIQARRQRKGGLHWHGHVVTATHSDKRQTWPSTDYFKRLLEEACPNHAYPIRHKLKDCDMMKSFMVLRCLTRGTELDKDPGGRNTMAFPEEDAVMTVYEGCPSPRKGGVICLN